MKFKVKPNPDATFDKLGQERIIRRFLLWPMKIGNEWRWLEHVEYVEAVKAIHRWTGAFDGPSLIWRESYEWVPQEWLVRNPNVNWSKDAPSKPRPAEAKI